MVTGQQVHCLTSRTSECDSSENLSRFQFQCKLLQVVFHNTLKIEMYITAILEDTPRNHFWYLIEPLVKCLSARGLNCADQTFKIMHIVLIHISRRAEHLMGPS